MGTVYNFEEEVSSLTTGSPADTVLLYDASSGYMKRTTVSTLGTRIMGVNAADTLGFYGVTAVNQGTMTATALTAIGTTTISAANTNAVFGFASSTVGAALILRAAQAQDDLATLMARVDSTGLLAISGLP